MSTELVTSEHQTRGPSADLRAFSMSLPAAQMQAQLAEYSERRKTFRDWLKSQLVAGVHYGYPPGLEPKRDRDGNYQVFSKGAFVVVPPEQWQPKECLYKAGADFLCDLFGALDSYEADMGGWQQLGSPAGTFVYRCTLTSRATGEVLGEGRGARRVGTKGGDENNAIKMAKKSSKVDAVLNGWGLADLFTQDLDDAPPPTDNPPVAPHAKTATPRSERPSVASIPKMIELWRSLTKDPSIAEWAAFVSAVTGKAFTEQTVKASVNWTAADVQAVSKELERIDNAG